MSYNGKIVMGLFFLASHVSFSMDKDGLYPNIAASIGQQLARSGSSGALGEQSSQSNMFSVALPTFGDVTNFLSSGISSVARTVRNAASDDEAFKKLGWPRGNFEAQFELAETLRLYNAIKTEQDAEMRNKYLNTILNRTGYLTRVYMSLPHRPDGVVLAQHCIDHHSVAMNDHLKDLFTQYLQEKAAESAQAADSARRRLTKEVKEEQATQIPSNSLGLQSSGLKTESIDPKIFRKLGWAIEDDLELAKTHLMRCLAAYKIKQSFKDPEFFKLLQTEGGRKKIEIPEDKIIVRMIADFGRLCRFVDQKAESIKIIYSVLASRVDGVGLAAYCLQHHAYVMSASQQDDFRSFIQKQTEHISGIASKVLTLTNSSKVDDKKDNQIDGQPSDQSGK